MQELKDFRKSMNMTAEAFADSICVSKSLYEKVEKLNQLPKTAW